jgi:FkbM family methyltransferase
MNEYALHIRAKTKFLNFFRLAFTNLLLERFFIKQVERNAKTAWRKLIPPDYLYKKGALRRTKINGVEFLFDISNVVEHLAYFRIAPENFKPVEYKIKTAKVIVDAGANVGSTTLLFASENPGAEIYSFEPHPDTYQKAVTNIQLNAFDKIQIFNLGLGAVKESKKLYEVIANNPGMNRMMPGENPYPFRLIEIITLDDFCTEHNISQIDFLKVDVEGFEYFVLLGGKTIISKTHPVIYLELYDHGLKKHGYSASQLIAWLFEMGYTNILNAYTLTQINKSTDLINCDIDIIASKT